MVAFIYMQLKKFTGKVGMAIQASLVRVFVVMGRKLGRKGFIWITLSYHSPSLKAIRAGTGTQTR